MGFINIAKNAKVTFSSTSQHSTDDDCKKILTAEHNRDYSFHTDLENNPWVELDLGAVYVLHNIVVYNIKNIVFQHRANKLQVAISEDKINYEIIHKGFIPFKDKFEFNLDSLKTARYVKLSINDYTYLHLSKIEIFIDESKNSNLIFDNPSIPDKIKFNTFYIGSCRYEYLFPKHFPARLHTTKEIINFLNNYNKIDLNMDDANYIYGDLLHPLCIHDSVVYCNNMNHIFDSVTTVFLEITSRKYILNNGVIFNNYYYNHYNRNNDKTITIIDDDELFSDLRDIKSLFKNLFGIESLVVIPHISLLLDNGEKIDAREDLKSSLEKICEILNIEFLDVNKAFPEGSYFKDFAPDSKHYSKKGSSLALSYVNDYLISFVPETYDVDGCLVKDMGTTSDYNDNMWYSVSNFTRCKDGTTVILSNQTFTNQYFVGGGHVIELELLEPTERCVVQIGRYQYGKETTYNFHHYTTSCKVRIEVTPTQIIFKQDDAVVQTINNSTNNKFSFFFIDPTSNFKYKNFMIYPI